MIIVDEKWPIFNSFKLTPGAFAVTEGIGMYNIIRKYLKAEEGIVADCGSHAGKSSMFAALAFKDMGRSEEFNMVDLLYDLSNPEWSTTWQGRSGNNPYWPYASDPAFLENCRERVSVFAPNGVKLNGRSSLQFIAEHDQFSYIFIDTDDHREELVRSEAKALGNKVLPGGLILFHDYLNQYVGPSHALNYLVSTGKYEQVTINWNKIKAFVYTYNLEAGNHSWQPFEGNNFPTFVGGVRRK